ncbi:MAG: 6-phosphofructokinase [Anaerolineae bacterium]|nr:6-phosphofructokinase [Anaerolineae bacterium]
MTQYIGVLTAGGDSPGLNAAIRGVGKTGMNAYGMQIIGFRDGFRGLMENRTVTLNASALSGILTIGGTILGTSRDKPQKMPIGNKTIDMTDVMVETYHKHHLDVLVCLGGGGTQKNAFHLMQNGLNIITMPKTIDNDVAMTDATFGYDTALTIATEAIDRLHSTAHSHHRIIVVEVMGHNTGWLALGAGIAGGADVILIPEIPYNVEKVAESIRQRVRDGKGFSIVAVSEGAMPQELNERIQVASKDSKSKKAKAELEALEAERLTSTQTLTQQLEALTGLESRVTILGHVQRGGIPSPADRLLATRLGAACARYIHEGIFGVMVAARGDSTEPVPLEQVVGKRKTVPLDHPWVETARNLGISLGD